MRINVNKGEIQNTWFLLWNLLNAVEKCTWAKLSPPYRDKSLVPPLALPLRNEKASKSKALVRKAVIA